jgi:hypothetical protein
MTVRRLATLVFVLALALSAAACGGDDETTVDLPDGGQVDIDQNDDGGITVEGPSGGEVDIGTGDYPEGWPTDFPVPEGASPAYSVGAAGSASVWFSTDQSVDDVVAFYTSALPGAGYTIDSTMDFNDASGSYTVMSISGNGLTGGIYAGENLGSVAAGYEGDFDFWVSLSPAA